MRRKEKNPVSIFFAIRICLEVESPSSKEEAFVKIKSFFRRDWINLIYERVKYYVLVNVIIIRNFKITLARRRSRNRKVFPRFFKFFK